MITEKMYYCPLCGHRVPLQTNHTQEVYVQCKECGNDVLYCEQAPKIESTDTVKLVPYKYDLNREPDKNAYFAMCDTLKTKFNYKPFDVIAPMYGKATKRFKAWQNWEEVPIPVRNPYQWEGQYVTAAGRLHNWYEFIYPNKKIKEGYYLIKSFHAPENSDLITKMVIKQ